MEQSSIFEPVIVMLVLTLLVWVYMYARRIPFIRKNNFGPDELTALELQKRSPPEVANPSDNLKNLFELPVIFYFLSIFLYLTNQVDQVYLIASWSFVVFRIFHSIVHCTFNLIMLRFSLYLVSALSLWFIVLRIGFETIA